MDVADKGTIGLCASHLADCPGEGSSLVLSYTDRRDQQGSLRSVR